MTGGDEKDAGRALGSEPCDRYVDAANLCAQELVDAGSVEAQWVKPFLRAVNKGRLSLPSLSPAVARVIRLIESTEVDLDELADAITQDPSLATRVMGVANSTYFRGATDVPNVREALMRMGVREARGIVIVVALRSTVLSVAAGGAAALALWKHSLLTASVAQEVASEIPCWANAGLLAGLVHDIGRIVVLAFATELPDWQEAGGHPGEANLSKIADATHAALGAMVLTSWAFPESFCEAVFCHHRSDQASGDAALLAAAVELADHVARQIETGWPDDPEELDQALASLGERLGLPVERLAEIAIEAEMNFEALSKVS